MPSPKSRTILVVRKCRVAGGGESGPSESPSSGISVRQLGQRRRRERERVNVDEADSVESVVYCPCYIRVQSRKCPIRAIPCPTVCSTFISKCCLSSSLSTGRRLPANFLCTFFVNSSLPCLFCILCLCLTARGRPLTCLLKKSFKLY